MEKEVTVKEFAIPKKSVIAPSEAKMKKESTEKIKLEAESKSSVKKSFKLMDIMYQQNQPSPTPKDEASHNIVIKEPKQEETVPNIKLVEEKKRPSWMRDYPSIEHKQEGDIDRWLSMKFLSQAVRFFPLGKDIDYSSIARALEDAIYIHLGKNCEDYWDRVHDICGALVGKNSDAHKHQEKLGHLARKIIAGEYKTPMDVIKIPKKTLLQSYEGHWIA